MRSLRAPSRHLPALPFALALLASCGDAGRAPVEGPVPPPPPPTLRWTLVSSGEPLTGAWGSGPNNIYVSGTNGRIMHFDGAGWSQMITGTNADLRDISGSGPGVCTAVGDGGTVLRLESGAWRGERIPTSADLYGVWQVGPTVYAVGAGGRILRRSGGRWSMMDVMFEAGSY